MSRNKVLYVTHELAPYHEITDIANTASQLPGEMSDKGMEVRVFMPRFGTIKERKHRLHEVIRLSGINIPVGEDDNPLIIKVASLPQAKLQVYFLDNEDYFNKRGFIGDDKKKFYEDNDERVIFFNKGIMEILLKLGWIPDVIHCHGWMSALVPMYARTVAKNEPVFRNTRIVYSVYQNDFEEKLGAKFVSKALINGQKEAHFDGLDNPGCGDLYLSAINFADAIVVGSPNLSDEVQSCLNKLEKPTLEYLDYQADGYAERVHEFYQNLLEPELSVKG